MIIRTPQSLGDYVMSLDLAAPEKPASSNRRLARAESGNAAYVDGSSAMTFVSNVSTQVTQDVLNSTLLAQLAANKAFDRESGTEAWYGKYREVLENVGWVTQNFGFSRFTSSDSTLSLDKAALNILRAILSGSELAVLEQTLGALAELPGNDAALNLFDSQGSQKEAGNFQLGTVTVDPGGNASMSLGAFYFKSTEHRKRWLWIQWKSSTINFYTSAQKVVLNEKIYSTVRQKVIDKLGGSAGDFIDNIEI